MESIYLGERYGGPALPGESEETATARRAARAVLGMPPLPPGVPGEGMDRETQAALIVLEAMRLSALRAVAGLSGDAPAAAG